MSSSLSPPSPSFHEIKACQFSSWYSTFRNLQKDPPTLKYHTGNSCSNSSSQERVQSSYPYNNVTIRSIIIKPLPADFIQYLKSDGVILPTGAEKVSSFLPDVKNGNTNDDCWSSDEEDDVKEEAEDGEAESDSKKTQYHFPELNEQIQNALDALGPSLPKLNWSSPKDVTWLNAESLKCSTVGDVYLLLQSSDFCMFDLTHALDGVEKEDGLESSGDIEFELVLRKWSNLHASMEFRCFVSGHNFVSRSQRNHTQHFPHLKNDFMSIRSQIIDFFISTIQHTYANNTVSNFTFDIYIDKNERVWLIDFNVWATRTDPLLFKWEEIMKIAHDNPSSSITDVQVENSRPEMRVVLNENEVKYDPLSSYRAPVDTVDLASENFGSHSFHDFMAMCQPPSAMSDSDGDDDDDDDNKG